MQINISIDGNFWTALSAIGTIMASIVALLGAYKPFQKKLDITFVWGERNQSVPQLIIQNLSNRSVVIKKVQFTLQNRLIGVVNMLGDYGFGRYALFFVILPFVLISLCTRMTIQNGANVNQGYMYRLH